MQNDLLKQIEEEEKLKVLMEERKLLEEEQKLMQSTSPINNEL